MATPGGDEYREGMDMTVDRQLTTPGPPPARRVPWSPRAWGQAVSVAGGIPVQLIPWLLLALLVRSEQHSYGGWNGIKWVAALLASAVLGLLLIPLLTRIQSHRLRSAGWTYRGGCGGRTG
jgi:hypothetical protein